MIVSTPRLQMKRHYVEEMRIERSRERIYQTHTIYQKKLISINIKQQQQPKNITKMWKNQTEDFTNNNNNNTQQKSIRKVV